MTLKLTRRQGLLLGVVGAPAAATAALALRHDVSLAHLVSPSERAALKVLDPHGYATLKAVLSRLLRASPGSGFPSPDAVGAALYAEGYLAGLPARDREDLGRLLDLVAHVLPLTVGSTRPFVALPGEAQDAVLRGLERAPSELLRGAFAGLKQLAALAYFRAPETFRAIGYSGPLVTPSVDPSARPARGARIPLSHDLRYDVDAVVVGAGAGGSMAARELARAGARVLLLEEGPDHPPESFTQREDEMLAALYQDRGGRTTRDRAIMVLQGRGLGGSTIHNQNLCKRTPDAILGHWSSTLGLRGWSPEAMAPLFAEVERDLGIAPIGDSDVNANNRALEAGARALGWRTARLAHNRDGCLRSGFCELGCAYDGKNHARKVLIPQAVRAGAVVRASTKALRVLTERGRASGVEARDESTGALVRVRARAVVLAASAVGSAALAIESELPDPLGRHGAGLHLHPGSVVAGVFPGEIAGWRGIPQSIECTEHLDVTPGSDRRVWIVPGFAHPVGSAAMTSGFGPPWLDAMREYPRTAALIAMLHDETEGRVTVSHGRPVIDYVLNDRDRAELARGLRACGELLLAAGATKVVVPLTRPLEARTARELRALTPGSVGPMKLPVTAVHPMSSMRAGTDPAVSVCDPRGEHHHVRGLFIADGGLFPTSLGTPPQVSIYTAGMKVGRAVADALRGA